MDTKKVILKAKVKDTRTDWKRPKRAAEWGYAITRNVTLITGSISYQDGATWSNHANQMKHSPRHGMHEERKSAHNTANPSILCKAPYIPSNSRREAAPHGMILVRLQEFSGRARSSQTGTVQSMKLDLDSDGYALLRWASRCAIRWCQVRWIWSYVVPHPPELLKVSRNIFRGVIKAVSLLVLETLNSDIDVNKRNRRWSKARNHKFLRNMALNKMLTKLSLATNTKRSLNFEVLSSGY